MLSAVMSPEISAEPGLDSSQSHCLEAWIDTLLPMDEVSPAASEFGVDADIANKARDDPSYLRLISKGCLWLDQQARKRGMQGFAQLDEAGRERIVSLAEQAKTRSVPRAFFERTRSDAFQYYYARPESWDMLNYAGPPQPQGFPDYTQAPPGPNA